MEEIFQGRIMKFIGGYLEVSIRFDVNVPNSHFVCIWNIAKRLRLENRE